MNVDITLSRCAMSAPHRAHADRQRSLDRNEADELGQWLRYEPKGWCDRSGDRQLLERAAYISVSGQSAWSRVPDLPLKGVYQPFNYKNAMHVSGTHLVYSFYYVKFTRIKHRLY